MTKAYLFDSLCGIVYRCMFAGIDELGRAQWVNITPGEEPKTLEDYVIDEDLQGTRFFVLTMEGETAQSSQIAKILGKVAECPVNGLGMDLTFAIKHMQDMGVKWNQKPLKAVSASASTRFGLRTTTVVATSWPMLTGLTRWKSCSARFALTSLCWSLRLGFLVSPKTSVSTAS